MVKCQKHSNRGDGRCFFCGLPIKEEIPQPPKEPKPGRGGRRVGAGAPKGNLNALKDGGYSLQLKRLHQEEKRILQTAREKRAKRIGHPAPS